MKKRKARKNSSIEYISDPVDLSGVNLDEDPFNADWLRTGADLPPEVRNHVRELREYINSTGMTVEEFKRLPLYVNAKKRGYPAFLAL